MTKVEELRRIVVNAWEQHLIRDCEYALANEVHDTVNALISAALAQGKAEGAERERERISNIVCPDEDEHGDLTIGWLSLSVLAPTKEKAELTKEEYDNLFRGTFSGADAIKEKP